MNFSAKLRKAMNNLQLSQRQLCALTGLGASSVSQYLSGAHEPSRERKRLLAEALGLEASYFDDFLLADGSRPETVISGEVANLPVDLAARLMHKSREFVEQGLRDGVFPFGYAVKLKHWSYFISPKKFTEYTGIEVPVNEGGKT